MIYLFVFVCLFRTLLFIFLGSIFCAIATLVTNVNIENNTNEQYFFLKKEKFSKLAGSLLWWYLVIQSGTTFCCSLKRLSGWHRYGWPDFVLKDSNAWVSHFNRICFISWKLQQKEPFFLKESLVLSILKRLSFFRWTMDKLSTYLDVADSFAKYRSSHQRCSVKKVFLEISRNSQENICARASFLIKLQADLWATASVNNPFVLK